MVRSRLVGVESFRSKEMYYGTLFELADGTRLTFHFFVTARLSGFVVQAISRY
jgi:hypothetical protein